MWEQAPPALLPCTRQNRNFKNSILTLSGRFIKFSWVGFALYLWYALVRQWTGVVSFLKDRRKILLRTKCLPVPRKGNCCWVDDEEEEVKEVWLLEHPASYWTVFKSSVLSFCLIQEILECLAGPTKPDYNLSAQLHFQRNLSWCRCQWTMNRNLLYLTIQSCLVVLGSWQRNVFSSKVLDQLTSWLEPRQVEPSGTRGVPWQNALSINSSTGSKWSLNIPLCEIGN